MIYLTIFDNVEVVSLCTCHINFTLFDNVGVVSLSVTCQVGLEPAEHGHDRHQRLAEPGGPAGDRDPDHAAGPHPPDQLRRCLYHD